MDKIKPLYFDSLLLDTGRSISWHLCCVASTSSSVIMAAAALYKIISIQFDQHVVQQLWCVINFYIPVTLKKYFSTSWGMFLIPHTYVKCISLNQDEILQLIEKYLGGSATEQEIQILLSYYDSFQHSDEWNEAVLGNQQQLERKMMQRLKETIHPKRPSVSTRFYRTRLGAVAAAFILVTGCAILWIMIKQNQPKQSVTAVTKIEKPVNDVNGSKAILTLANGKQISLDSAANGVVANQNNSIVHKQNGQLIYQLGKESGAVANTYNTLATKAGGEYLIVLPDGTKVWLNAASALRFPTAFSGKERQVEITGEAYFEVAKNASMPFKVSVMVAGKSSGMVEVLGTHFNINGYSEEDAVKTTLLEGSVKITPASHTNSVMNNSRILKPGQQAQLFDTKGPQNIQVIDNTDLEEVMAWKNGLFNFKDADIKTIMGQVARWYDVQVIYEGNIPARSFSGKMKRSTDISGVLAILEQSDIHFEMQGKKILVKP